MSLSVVALTLLLAFTEASLIRNKKSGTEIFEKWTIDQCKFIQNQKVKDHVFEKLSLWLEEKCKKLESLYPEKFGRSNEAVAATIRTTRRTTPRTTQRTTTTTRRVQPPPSSTVFSNETTNSTPTYSSYPPIIVGSSDGTFVPTSFPLPTTSSARRILSTISSAVFILFSMFLIR